MLGKLLNLHRQHFGDRTSFGYPGIGIFLKRKALDFIKASINIVTVMNYCSQD